MLDSTKIQTLKNGLSLAVFVRDELRRRSETGLPAENIDKNLISEIISGNPEARAKLPSDPEAQESVCKVIAAQIRIADEINEKESITKDELMNLLNEPCVSEAIQETGMTSKDVREILGNTFDMLIGLSTQLTASDPISQMFAGSILVKLRTFGISDKELNELSKNKKISLSLLPKLSQAAKDSGLAPLIEGRGINLSLLELLPLLLDPSTSSVVSSSSVPEKPATSPLTSSSPAPQPEEIVGAAIGGVLEGLGFKKEGEEKKTTTQEQKDKDKKEEKVGWGNGYGKWILGGCSALLGSIGFFVEDNVIKTVLIGFGALGVGGAIASNVESVQTMFGAPPKPQKQS